MVVGEGSGEAHSTGIEFPRSTGLGGGGRGGGGGGGGGAASGRLLSTQLLY